MREQTLLPVHAVWRKEMIRSIRQNKRDFWRSLANAVDAKTEWYRQFCIEETLSHRRRMKSTLQTLKEMAGR